MCVSCNDCPPQVDWLKTGWKLLRQRNVIPECDNVDDYDDDSDGDDVYGGSDYGNDDLSDCDADHDHLRNTTRCMAVRNSSRERQPSLGTKIITSRERCKKKKIEKKPNKC